ncbi:MAG TPA: NAD-binding protein [Mycobacteriales bacterium]|nr:NAD-binding protein [Mycobacteriales bacterium]
MPRRSGHFIVCGCEPLTVRLVEELRRLDEDVIVIAPSRRDGMARDVRALGAAVIESARPDGEAFRRARLPAARALALVDQDDVGNIRAALAAQELNPHLRLVIRMFNSDLGDRLRGMFDDAAMLSEAALAAPSFVASALGELAANHVVVADRTLVVAVRDRTTGDILCGLADTTAPGGTRLLPDNPDDADLVLAVASGQPGHPLRAHTRSRAGVLLRAARTARALVDRRLRIAFAVLVGLLALGTGLYAVFGSFSVTDAGYAVVLTAAGSGDITLESTGWLKAVQICTTVIGLTMVPVVTAAVVDAIVSSRLSRALGPQPGRVTAHTVVCGLGDVGSTVMGQLHALGVPLVGVERDGSAAGTGLARRLGIPVVLGDASLTETLRAARVEHSRCVLSLTDDDETNLVVGLSTRSLRSDARVVLRLFDGELARLVERRFDLALSRSVSMLAAPAFAAAMLERRLVATIPVGHRVLVLADVPVAPGSALDGSPVSRANLPGDARVLALTRTDGEVHWTPHPGVVLTADDRLLVLATRTGLSHVLLARAPAVPLTSGNDP